ncbi:hypothetical protein [Marinobacter sp. NFXS9]|uniref:hypothetical protein n=1 Tax=Marinobacter sp. NFXS9 TaxID=2818433 RepID=UPI0032DFD4C5
MNELIEMETQDGRTWAMARSRWGKRVAKVGVALSTGAMAGVAAAADHSEKINTAFGDGSTNVGAAVTGVIALVAIVTGLGLIVSILRR